MSIEINQPFRIGRRDALLAGLGFFALPRLGFGRRQDTTFSTDVKVVNVFATVHDKKGQVVENLAKDDFALSEDGRPQEIKYFARQTDLPLVLGLLVDTSGSMRRLIGKERAASQTFVDQVLRDGKDKFFLIHFDREAELLRDMTSSKKEMQAGLDLLGQEQQDQQTGNGGSGGGGPYGGGGRRGGGMGRRGGGGTVLYDSVLLASDDLMKGQTPRKAVILLTDGEDNGSKVSLDDSIHSAQRTDTLVYSIRYADSEGGGFGGPRMGGGRHGGMGGGWPGGGMGGGGRGGPMGTGNDRPDGKKVLQQLSKQTGGGYFEVTSKMTVEDIYAKIETELRNQYSLGYTSDKPAGTGEFRRIDLTTKQKGLVVQTREGYYAGA